MDGVMGSGSTSPRLSSAPAAAATFVICCAVSVDTSAEKNTPAITAATSTDDIDKPFLVRLLSEMEKTIARRRPV
ncbi:hypothetical protein OsI_24256 [Oryza sativa Indica Group]|uniref:Uncharacterized protein n=2 Tax=Oryza sativa TaxID=4530 RepID=B9FQL6_ORYSJ|nr:hypothetical protein OsI_24256 [Oryza sativa Indica Group]EEE66258.1 hypothetical protein OsJ_22443 [Oryza sativa Japonica Group]